MDSPELHRMTVKLRQAVNRTRLVVSDATIPQNVVCHDDSSRAHQTQQLLKVVPVHALVAICAQVLGVSCETCLKLAPGKYNEDV